MLRSVAMDGVGGRSVSQPMAVRHETAAVTPPSASGHRPAPRELVRGLLEQAIPRTIHQTGRTYSSALAAHASYMQAWWRLNPEYEYRFYSDILAHRFVQAHATSHERAAWMAVRTGAQRADLFRLLVLRYAGGVYADVDTELRTPLRDVVPSNASAVLGRFWSSEFMAFAPGHPLLVRALRTVVANVHRQITAIAAGDSTRHCGSPHSCVLLVTGPFALRAAFSSAATYLGCQLRGNIGSASRMSQTCPEEVRRTHVCLHDSGNVYRTWACGAAYHWDCRNSGAKRACGANHYSRHKRGPNAARAFFNASFAVAVPKLEARRITAKGAPLPSKFGMRSSTRAKSVRTNES